MALYTRRTIEAEFKVENGRILSPGQYEGEPIYAPYFDAKTEVRGKAMHTIRDADYAEFPELRGYKTVVVSHEPTGHVTVQAFANADYW